MSCFSSEVDSVLTIDRSHLKPHHWRGPNQESFSSLLNPKAPGPLQSVSGTENLNWEEIWGEVVALETVLILRLDAQSCRILGSRIRSTRKKNAEKVRQDDIRQNEEWLLTQRNFKAHSVFVDESLLPLDAS